MAAAELAAEGDGATPDAAASVSMKTSQKMSDDVRGGERYPEELGSMRLCQLNNQGSAAQELTARIQAPAAKRRLPSPWGQLW